MMLASELHAKMAELHVRYREAIEANKLGRALIVLEEAGALLACEWPSVLAALERWAQPLSYGSEPREYGGAVTGRFSSDIKRGD